MDTRIARPWPQRAPPGIGGAWEEDEALAMHVREGKIQRAVADLLRRLAWPDVVWTHVANGGYRSRVEAAIMNGHGVLAGWPDLDIRWRNQSYFLELKTEEARSKKNGGLSEDQITVLQRLSQTGAEVAVAYGVDEAHRQLDAWGLLQPHRYG